MNDSPCPPPAPSVWQKIFRPYSNWKKRRKAEAKTASNQAQEFEKLLKSFTQLIKRQIKPFQDDLTTIQSLEQKISQLHSRLDQIQQEQKRQRLPADLLMDGMAHFFKPSQVDVPQDFLISIITPVWNRQQTLPRALRSLQAQSFTQWECLIVDDGSDDASASIAEEFTINDARFQVIRQTNQGSAIARNVAIQKAAGSVIAYLDSDNEFTPDYLAHLATAYITDSQVMCTCAAIRYMDWVGGPSIFYGGQVDRPRLLQSNTVDLNSFSHRKVVWEQRGGFDVQLKRLQDWDIVLRYTEDLKTITIPIIAAHYYIGEENRITTIESHGYAHHLIQSKHAPEPIICSREVRVLIIMNPDLPATAQVLRHEVAAMIHAGFKVQTRVWSNATDTAALQHAMTEFHPEIIHIVSLRLAHQLLQPLSQPGIAITCRGLEGEYIHPDKFAALQNSTNIKRLYVDQSQDYLPLFNFTHTRIIPCGIHLNGHHPNLEKDPSLVLVTGDSGSSTLPATLAQLAEAAPAHRFVADQPLEQDHSNLLQAGLILQIQDDTSCALHSSRIIEAMACGCIPLLPATDAWKHFFGEERKGMLFYANLQEAVQILHTSSTWSASTWRSHKNRCLDLVYPDRLARHTLLPVLKDWKSLTQSQKLS